MKSFILFGVVLSLFMVEGGWTQVYVCGITGDDTNTGRDHWKNAVATLQRGVDIVDLSAEGEVWVAQGVYAETRNGYPQGNPGDPAWNTGSLILVEDKAMLGGFPTPSPANPDPGMADRNWELFETIIDVRQHSTGFHQRCMWLWARTRLYWTDL